MEDSRLLREYTDQRSQRAFTELVNRYADMVYSACMRQLRDPGQAQDATQAVFLAFSKKAAKLTGGPVSGWLLKASGYAAANIRRMEARRKKHEKEAAGMRATESELQAEWKAMVPVLDDVLMKLSAGDRDAVALRFFQKKSHADIGASLGVSEDAARKRVANALKKLRGLLSRKGIALPAAMIVTVLSENAVHAAPAGLAGACTAIVMDGAVGGAAVSGSVALVAEGVLKMMMWAKMKVAAALLCAIILAGGGAGIAVKVLANEGQEPPAPLEAVASDPAPADDPVDPKAGQPEPAPASEALPTEGQPASGPQGPALEIPAGFAEVVKREGDMVCHAPQWSPDGRAIVFTRGNIKETSKAPGGYLPPPHQELWLFDLALKKARLLVPKQGIWTFRTVAWSPDGAYIYAARCPIHAGARKEGLPGDLLQVDAKGSQSPKTIASIDQSQAWPTPLNFLQSPDGKELVVFGGATRGDQLLNVNTDDPTILDLTAEGFSGYHGGMTVPKERKDEIRALIPWARMQPGHTNTSVLFVEDRPAHDFKVASVGKSAFDRQWSPKGVGTFKGQEIKFTGRPDGLFYASNDRAGWSDPVKRPGEEDIYAFAAQGHIWVYRHEAKP